MAKIQATVDDELKDNAQKVFDELGLSFSTAIEIYLKAVVREGGIPFSLSTHTLSPQKEAYHYSVVEFPFSETQSTTQN
jgi:addiction module RelB/DinJ family antitoxin